MSSIPPESPESLKPNFHRSQISPTSKIIETNRFLRGSGKFISRIKDLPAPPNDVEKQCESSSSTTKEESGFFEKFSSLSAREFAMIALLALGNLSSTTAFSCIAPFYPDEAKLKELDVIETGIIFGAFDLVMIVTSPLFGKYMHIVGAKKMFSFGLFFAGITSVAFGFLDLLPNGSTFFWASLFVRCAQAIGDTAIVTSALVICAKSFPGQMSFIVGIMETFVGLGYTIGPFFGGVFYELGGFKLPFIVLGLILIFATIAGLFLINDFNEKENEEENDGKQMRDILKIPVIWIMIFAVILCATSFTFVDPTLSDHLSEFHLSTTVIGLLFLVCGGLYSITAPIWGILIDRWRCCNALLIFGATLTMISMLMIGPTPILKLEKNLFIVGTALAILGIGSGALYIPTFQNCLDAVQKQGFDDSSRTYGAVSGIFQSAFALGSFIGPAAGGYGVKYIGFEWSATIIASANFVFVLLLLAIGLITKKF
uniref:Major facilitator superfamily (MFS) profile domain-containing protein n=1 Tax=Panagrolaimus sp. ES5 TaxID=591445 RepID=A0AC34FZR6_9BILA